MHTSGVRCFFLVALLSACDEAPPPGMDAGRAIDAGGTGTFPCSRDASVDANGARGPTSVCAEGLVLSGFGLRWDDGSHRVSRWGVFPRIGAEHFPDGCAPTAVLRGANVVAEIAGGPEAVIGNAAGEVDVTYHVVGGGGGGERPDGGSPDGGSFVGLRIARGETTVELEGEEGEAPALFDLALAGMSDAPSVAVVLEGLELRTDVPQSADYPDDYSPADGYSTRGIGAWIEGVAPSGDDLRFRVGARFALGTRDRPAMNSAVGGARTRAIVHWAVVALPIDAARETIAYREQHRAHGDRELAVCRPDAAVTELSIQGSPGLRAAPALSSFRLRLFPDEDIEGDDVRELSIRVHGFSYDEASGSASMRVEGYASNDGPPPPALAMDYLVEAEVVLLQWSSTEESEELRYVAPIVVGRNEVMLPIVPR